MSTLSTVYSKFNNKFSRDTFFSLIARFVEIGSAFLVNFIVAKRHGNDGIGIFNQSLALYMLIIVIVNFGLANSIVKFCSEVAENTTEILQEHFRITFLVSIPGIFLLCVIVNFFPGLFSNREVAQALFISLLSAPFFLLNKNFFAYFNAIRSLKLLSFLRALRWALIIISILVLSLFTSSISKIMFSFLIAETLLLVINLIYVRFNILKNLFVKFEHRFLTFGVQTLVAEILSTLSDKISIIILGYMLSKNDIGVYSLLITIASALLYFQQSIGMSFNPIISRLFYESKFEELQQKVKMVMRISGVITIFATALMIPAFFILQWYILPNQLVNTFGIYVILLLAVAILSPYYWSGGMLIMGGYTKENMFRTIFMLTVNVISLSILSWLLGVKGAAISLVVYNFVAVLVQYFSIKKFMNISLSIV